MGPGLLAEPWTDRARAEALPFHVGLRFWVSGSGFFWGLPYRDLKSRQKKGFKPLKSLGARVWAKSYGRFFPVSGWAKGLGFGASGLGIKVLDAWV